MDGHGVRGINDFNSAILELGRVRLQSHRRVSAKSDSVTETGQDAEYTEHPQGTSVFIVGGNTIIHNEHSVTWRAVSR